MSPYRCPCVEMLIMAIRAKIEETWKISVGSDVSNG